jgi:hypothetical protein
MHAAQNCGVVFGPLERKISSLLFLPSEAETNRMFVDGRVCIAVRVYCDRSPTGVPTAKLLTVVERTDIKRTGIGNSGK